VRAAIFLRSYLRAESEFALSIGRRENAAREEGEATNKRKRERERERERERDEARAEGARS